MRTLRTESTDGPLTTDLCEHAAALRRVARGILGDAHAAEDVVQETWVRALRRPPAARDALRGWLAAVTRSLALRRLRGDGRRRVREGLGGGLRAVGTSAAEVAERRQALARLTAAVLALEEPYQTAILLRFYDDLPPRAVAARLGVPLATAKSRIARGLARLRERVDADLAEDGTTPERAFAFLVGPALPVLPGAPGAPGATPAPAGGAGAMTGTTAGAAGATAGAIAMGMQAKIVAGLAAAALVGFLTWHGLARDVAGPPVRTQAQREVAAQTHLAFVDAGSAPLAASQLPEERAPLGHATDDAFADGTREPAVDPYEFVLAGVVVGADDLPSERTQVYIGPLGSPLNRAVETDADGRFRLAWRGPAPVVEIALTVHGHGAMSEMRRLVLPTGSTEVALRLEKPAGGTRDLLLWTEAGEMASVAVPVGRPTPVWSPEFGADPAGLGRFALHLERCPSASEHTLFASILRNTVVTVSWDDLSKVQLSGLDGEPEPSGFTLAGILRDARGEPVGDALVVLGSAPGRGDGARTTTAGDGSFRLEEIPAGTWHARAGGGNHGRAELRVDAFDGGERSWEAWLDPGLELRGRLVDAATGEPLAGWSVEASGDAPPCADGARTDAEGRFAIPNLPRCALRVLARPDGAPAGLAREIARAAVPSGEEILFELDAGAQVPGVALRVEDEAGAPIAGGEARLWSLATGRGATLTRTEECFVLPGPLPPGTYEAEALVPGRAPIRLGPIYVTGTSLAELGPLRVEPHGAVHLLESARDAAVLERWTAQVWEVRRDARLLVTQLTGALPGRLELPAGRYELDLAPNLEHAAVAELVARERAPAARRLAFDVEAGGKTVLELRRTQAAAAARERDAAATAAEAEREEPRIVALQTRIDRLDGAIPLEFLLAARIDASPSRTTCVRCH